MSTPTTICGAIWCLAEHGHCRRIQPCCNRKCNKARGAATGLVTIKMQGSLSDADQWKSHERHSMDGSIENKGDKVNPAMHMAG